MTSFWLDFGTRVPPGHNSPDRRSKPHTEAQWEACGGANRSCWILLRHFIPPYDPPEIPRSRTADIHFLIKLVESRSLSRTWPCISPGSALNPTKDSQNFWPESHLWKLHIPPSFWTSIVLDTICLILLIDCLRNRGAIAEQESQSTSSPLTARYTSSPEKGL